VLISGANVHDSQFLRPLLNAIPPVQGRRGAPRWTPKKLHADKAYNSRSIRQMLRERGIQVRIARKGIESKEKLGRYRWVVERTQSWFNRFRRLKVRYERRDDIHLALELLAACLINASIFLGFC
jgi:transposase